MDTCLHGLGEPRDTEPVRPEVAESSAPFHEEVPVELLETIGRVANALSLCGERLRFVECPMHRYSGRATLKYCGGEIDLMPSTGGLVFYTES